MYEQVTQYFSPYSVLFLEDERESVNGERRRLLWVDSSEEDSVHLYEEMYDWRIEWGACCIHANE